MDIAGSDVNTKDKIVLVASRVRFVGKAFFVFPLVEHAAFRVGGGYHCFLLLGRLFVAVIRKRLFPVFFPVFVYLVKQLFRIPFCLFGNCLFGLLFQIGTCLICVPSTKIASVSRYPSSAAAFSTQRNTYSTVAWLNRCLKL